EMAALEPFEEQQGSRTWISTFSVPTQIHITPTLRRLTLDFSYPGGETGTAEEALDRLPAPALILRTAEFTGKVLQLRIEPDCYNGASLFMDAAARLEAHSIRFKRKSQQFSVLLVARLVRHFAEQLAVLGDQARIETPVTVVVGSESDRRNGEGRNGAPAGE